MSTGPRLPLAAADAAARHLMMLWKMPKGAVVVGSVRRRKPDVGDLEILAPLPPGNYRQGDDLFYAIDATINPHRAGMFGGGGEPIGRAISGLAPGFKTARLEVSFKIDGTRLVVPVQVFRATPASWGWKTVMYTGPDDFGKYVLVRWKAAFGIPPTAQASVHGHLVNAAGEVVPVPTEQDVFRLARIGWFEPEHREAEAGRLFAADRRAAEEAAR